MKAKQFSLNEVTNFASISHLHNNNLMKNNYICLQSEFTFKTFN